MKEKLTLLYTTDLHGFLLADSYLSDQKSSFGLLQIASLIKRIRKEEDQVVYFDNGDTISGSLTSLRYGEDMRFSNPMIWALNELNCEFAVPGNHEFDFGRKYLDKAVEQSNFPWVAANLIKNRGGKSALGPAWHKFETNEGRKVVFVGLTTPETEELAHEDAVKGLSFVEPLQALDEVMEDLKEVDYDSLVVSFHGGYDCKIPFWSQPNDGTFELKSAICEKYPEIDVFFTGHTHGCVSDREINGVHTIQAACYGHYLGRVDMTWDDNNKLTISSDLLPVKGQRIEKGMLEGAQKILESTVEWLDEPIGESLDSFTFHSQREALHYPSRLMSLIHTVMQEYSQAPISAASFWKVDGWKAGEITRRTILNLVPDNYINVLQMDGKTLRQALERSLEFFYLEDNEIEHGSKVYEFDIWSGIYYVADVSRPPGKRLQKCRVSGDEVQDDKLYQVAFYHFRTNGALGYEMLQKCKVVWQSKKTMRDYLLDYMKKNYELSVPIEYNWKLVQSELSSS